SPSYTTTPNFINTYSYFTSPRFGFEWRPDSNVAIRASAGSGISPIDISNLSAQNGLLCPFPGLPAPTQYYTVSLSNPQLKPETSFGEDLGASIRTDRFSTLSTDIYMTNLQGQFFNNYELNGTHLGLPLYASQTRNLAHSRYEGFELEFDRHPPVGLFFTVKGSLQRGYAYDLPASFYTSSGGAYSTNLTIIANQNFNGGMNGIARVAYSQGFAQFGWAARSGFQASLNLSYYGNNNGFYRPAFLAMDLDGSIPITERTSLNVAVANLTNIYPNLYYIAGQFAVIPYAHIDPNGNIGQANAVQNLGPRHISATFEFKL